MKYQINGLAPIVYAKQGYSIKMAGYISCMLTGYFA